MRRTLFAIVVFLILFAVASICEAGNVETKKSRGITLSGEIELDSIFANREVNTVIYGLTGTGKRQSSATFSDPTITLNFDIWLANQVKAYLSLKTPEYLIDDLGSPAVPVGPFNMPRRMLEVDQAYVHIDQFGFKEFSIKLGIQDIVYDMLDSGNPFFIALGESEDAFVKTNGTPFQVPGNGMFEPRRVETGWRLGRQIEITSGLTPGEKVIVSGNFLIDSQTQLTGLESAVYDASLGNGTVSMPQHQH